MLSQEFIYKIIYRPPKVDPVAQEIQAVQNEVIRDRIVIKEVVRDAKQEAINKVTVMPDDVVAVEWNERLRKYRDGKTKRTSSVRQRASAPMKMGSTCFCQGTPDLEIDTLGSNSEKRIRR